MACIEITTNIQYLKAGDVVLVMKSRRHRSTLNPLNQAMQPFYSFTRNGASMKDFPTRWKEILRLVAFLVLFVVTVLLNVTCSKDDNNPASDPACGSGHVTWDPKAQVCRDQADNHIVPSSCCGQ